MKSPTSATPSGDRLIARLLMTALERAGNTVTLASRFRSYDSTGDSVRQQRLRTLGERLADRLVRRFRSMPAAERPRLWFTYHLSYKAPDWVGPRVSSALGIPYVVAEASYTPKQENGLWDSGFRSTRTTIAQADLVLGMNEIDAECVMPMMKGSGLYQEISPFIDADPFIAARHDRAVHRKSMGRDLDLTQDEPWLLTVAMMRPGFKVDSYRILARALARLADESWRLLVVGSGPAVDEVKAEFAASYDRISWLGQRESDEIPALYAACDAFVWPAFRETPGMCFLEAQAAGLPVVGCRAGGVPGVVEDQVTGFLPRHMDVAEFGDSVAKLIRDPDLRRTMGLAASRRIAARHSVSAASKSLAAAFGMLEL
jgi:glycosyltransferase involved in cell wall biosynthesis